MNNDGTKIIYNQTPESVEMLANIKRAMAITGKINPSTFNDAIYLHRTVVNPTFKG